MRRILLALLLAIASPLVAQRLPRTVTPHHYDLHFAPDFAAERFDGETTIEVTLSQPSREIVLHAARMEFQKAEIEAAGRRQEATVALEPANQFARLTVPETIPIGPATIRIRYRGTLNRDLLGLYLGHANGKKYASTQMEATDAREAFPSFDEPELKATFAISATIDDGHMAISNGAQISDTPGPAAGKHTVRFATTPRMSTYLVAMTIGDFRCASGEADGIPLRICGTPEKMPLAAYSMKATEFILPWFNNYYGIRYPFGKLDQTGVADFRAGAMENAGAILYRDAILFVDEKNSTLDDRQGTAGTISHEIAHMWFGDLVTMRWWDDIWLNEGFASWVTPKPLHAWHPEWKIPLHEVRGNSGTMAADSLRTSRKIRQQATTPDEIDELFDGIAYGKASAVLRMIESWIGEETMRRGVSSYLSSHSYGNTTFHDFAEAIRTEAKLPVDEVMTTFVEQPGVPLLRASTACENGNTVVTLEQERFFIDGKPAEQPQKWMIPVCFRSGNERRCAVVSERKVNFDVPGCGATVFLNDGGRGYYMLEHSPQMLDALLGGAESLGPAERMVLARDEWNLARSGRTGVDRYMRLVDAFKSEREAIALAPVVAPLFTISEDIVTDADRPAFEAWVRALARPMAKELGMVQRPGDTENENRLRALAWEGLVHLGGDLDAAREARKLIERDLSGKSRLDPETRKMLLPLAALAGDQKLYDRYLAAARAAKTPDEHYMYLYSLAGFRDPQLLRKTLELALSDEIKNQDAGGLMSSAVRNRYGREMGWAWVEENWPRIEKKLPQRMIGGVLTSGGGFCDAASLQRMEAFYKAHPVPSAARRAAQTIERMRQCIAMRELQGPKLHEWLMTTKR